MTGKRPAHKQIMPAAQKSQQKLLLFFAPGAYLSHANQLGKVMCIFDIKEHDLDSDRTATRFIDVNECEQLLERACLFGVVEAPFGEIYTRKSFIQHQAENSERDEYDYVLRPNFRPEYYQFIVVGDGCSEGVDNLTDLENLAARWGRL